MERFPKVPNRPNRSSVRLLSNSLGTGPTTSMSRRVAVCHGQHRRAFLSQAGFERCAGSGCLWPLWWGWLGCAAFCLWRWLVSKGASSGGDLRCRGATSSLPRCSTWSGNTICITQMIYTCKHILHNLQASIYLTYVTYKWTNVASIAVSCSDILSQSHLGLFKNPDPLCFYGSCPEFT